MERYFITGTDTDCGKTYITSCLMHYFPRAAAIKPVASGCMEEGHQLVSNDAQKLQKDKKMSLDLINPWRFKLPVSPHIAAQSEENPLLGSEIADYCLNLQLDHVDKLFIEGAGGLMVPLNEKETWIDFLQLTKIPVILVVGMKLGCINHALLTATALHAHKIKCVGWIANCLDPKMQALSENMATLTQKLSFPLLAQVSFAGKISDLNWLDNKG